MAFATLNGRDVVSATLTVPRAGTWRLDAVVDAESSAGLTGAVTLILGASTWKARVFRGGDAFGRVDLRAVGGAGGLAREIAGKSYRNTTAKVVLTDILAGVGEGLSLTISPSLLATPLLAWSRRKGSASTQLGALVTSLGPDLVWRILADGTLWVGSESWPSAPTFERELLAKDVRGGRWTFGAIEGYRLQPGQTLEGQRVAVVEHQISAEAIRTTVFFE